MDISNEEARVLSIHLVNEIEIFGSNGVQSVTVGGVELSKIIENAALTSTANDEYGCKRISFWGSLDIILTQEMPVEKAFGALK